MRLPNQLRENKETDNAKGGHRARLLMIGGLAAAAFVVWFTLHSTSTTTFTASDDNADMSGDLAGSAGGNSSGVLGSSSSLFDSLKFSFVDKDPISDTDTSPDAKPSASGIANTDFNTATTTIGSSTSLSDAEKTSIRDYLVASSNIAFPTPREVTFAALRHREGSSQDLLDLIASFQTKQKEFARLEPPAVLEDFHGSSYQVIQDYIGFLVRISAQSTKDNIDILMTSNETASIRSRGLALYNEIKAFTTTNSIELPADVLPD
ncbi:MAG: hypothetical protein UY09_C0023G0004 [Parcubacteria group bacterium GW2011_GWA2_47_8]|nr:MAG: hypothetical protein UY09_C0023G0004 [Parcubacteria group bacterium GW2011_GWA2_47_8]